jgi:[ribosomal protein S5]-alanine N-acetyltransferase
MRRVGTDRAFLFETPRLAARAWRASDDDKAAFHRIWGDPRVIWWGAAEDAAASARKLEEIASRAAAMPEGQGWFAVVERGSGEIVGNVVLQPYVDEPDVEIGWHFAHDAWGRGYATEAARALTRHGFERANASRIVADIVPDNLRSMRVAARLGMRKIGERTRASLPHVVLAITRAEAEAEAWWRGAPG